MVVAAFGTFVATGQKGLGNQDGGGRGGLGGDPLASTSCTDVHFGDIDALAESGCFLRDPRDPSGGAAIAQGPIRLNGVEVIPDPGVQIAIDPRRHTINTTGAVRVVLRTPGIGDITIWHGALDVNLAGSLAGAGHTLFEFDTSRFAAGLEGFPIEGMIDVEIRHDSVVIPISVKLPPYLGGISGAATLLADNVHGLQFGSLHIGVDDLVLGAMEIKNLGVDYSAHGNVWKGAATSTSPPARRTSRSAPASSSTTATSRWGRSTSTSRTRECRCSPTCSSTDSAAGSTSTHRARRSSAR